MGKMCVVVPAPGDSFWSGGIQFDGMFFPRWVSLVGGAISVSVVSLSLVQDRATPARLLYALMALMPFVCDLVAMLVRQPPSQSVIDRLDTLGRFVLPAAGVVGVLLLVPDSPNIGTLLLIYLVGELATTRSLHESIAWFAVSAGGIGLRMASPPAGDSAHAWASWLIGIGCAWIVGVVFQRMVRLITQLREAQASLADKVVTEERQRIAREVHDVIAHSLTVTMLHLTGARLTLEHDPGATDEAIRALEEAERLGRESLHDIRRTVGLLTTGTEDTVVPAPAASDLATLVDDFERAGQQVDLAVTGDLRQLSLSSGLALYRIVQESLTNVAKHSPGATAHLAISVDADGVSFSVTNACLKVPLGRSHSRADLKPVAGGGHGIIGMRQRAELLAGVVAAGPTPDGGWAVEGRLPLAGRREPQPAP